MEWKRSPGDQGNFRFWCESVFYSLRNGKMEGFSIFQRIEEGRTGDGDDYCTAVGQNAG